MTKKNADGQTPLRPATGDRRPATGDRRPATGDRIQEVVEVLEASNRKVIFSLDRIDQMQQSLDRWRDQLKKISSAE